MINQNFIKTLIIFFIISVPNLAFSQELEIDDLCKQISSQDREIARINGIDIDKICSAQKNSINDTNEIVKSEKMKK